MSRHPDEDHYVEARVPATNLVGSEGSGFGQTMAQFQVERVFLAVQPRAPPSAART